LREGGARRRRRWEGERFHPVRTKHGQDVFADTARVGQHPVVGKPQNHVSEELQILCAARVVVFALFMGRAIEFDDQLARLADEVGEVAVYRDLSQEPESASRRLRTSFQNLFSAKVWSRRSRRALAVASMGQA